MPLSSSPCHLMGPTLQNLQVTSDPLNLNIILLYIFFFIFKNFLTIKIPLNERILHLNLSGKNLAESVLYETFKEKCYHLKKQQKFKALRL